MALRILATADLHLGMRFAGYPELQARLTEARFAALEKLVALANQRECALLLVAGDLFEKLSLPQREIQRAAEALKGFEGEAVAILPGNHDYYTGAAGNPWKSFRDKAADRVLLLSEPRAYDLAHYGLAVRLYPGPCTEKHSRQHALGWLVGRSAEDRREEAPAGGRPLRIGLAHGAVEGYSPDQQGEYYPMRRSELEAAGLDFWVVGHTHRPQSDPDCCLFIPGTPEPDGFDCEHAGSVLLLEAEAGRVRAERLETGTFRFQRQSLELAEGQDPAAAFAGFHSPEHADTLLRLALRGLLSAEGLAAVHKELDRLRQAVAWLDADQGELAERITPERVEAEFARGSFSWLLLHRLLEAGDPEALQQAYALLREVHG
jgi:DNA repair exonuclease SbcCD nuclease subunit